MQIDSDTLPSLAVFFSLKTAFETHAKEITRPALLQPKFSLSRMRDAHYAWQDDMSRLKQHEKLLVDGLDHFKQCAHLAYWLRRQTPIMDYVDWADYEEGGLYPDEIEKREFLGKYGVEFIAFDFGFQICSYYELEKKDSPRANPPLLSKDYLVDVCHMLKFKHVSPHAMYLIYKSLFS